MCMSRSFEISFSSGRKIEVHSAVDGYMLNTEKLLSLISNTSSMLVQGKLFRHKNISLLNGSSDYVINNFLSQYFL